MRDTGLAPELLTLEITETLLLHDMQLALICAIVDLGHALKLEIVAEGVDDHSQLDFLRAAGCERAQGLHFSRPVPSPPNK